MTKFPDLVKAIRYTLAEEIQETILFYVGDVVLYFNFFEKHSSRFGLLVTHQGGAGFALEEAIKSGHKKLLLWLLTAVSFPIDYLLTCAVCYGDLDVLFYLINLIGEDYKEHDTPAKLLCLLKGKVHFLEHLFQRNPTFSEGEGLTEYSYNCLHIGISTSSEMYIWYMRNQHILPTISIEDRIKACIQNDNVPDALELIGGQNPIRLLRVLIAIPLGSEATYRELMHHYASEENVLTLIASACARLGYADTLEILFNEPYNVHVEYDFFVDIPNLAVVEILHKYASQRNAISSLLNKGWIQIVKNRLSVYQTPKCYLKLLEVFTKSKESKVQRRNCCWAGQQSEDVLLFLVDLAKVTSSARLVKKYILYGIECGHLRLLRVLIPLVKKSVLRSISQGIVEEDMNHLAMELQTEFPNIYQSERPELVEYLFEMGIYQPSFLRPLMQRFDLKFVQVLIERGLVIEDESLELMRWNSETREYMRLAYLANTVSSFKHAHQTEKAYLLELIRFSWDVFPFEKNYYPLESHRSSSVSFSTSTEFSTRFAPAFKLTPHAAETSHIYWAKCPNILYSNADLSIREVHQQLLFRQQHE
ncbi:hypothetical protein K493DRAFT_303297 [Basidiobolus meristosporus CBS 931.73]|uniref:Ankyrin n=1 Tax=Basidiobolus meristosporus CBS 931.73 TaxID=1314790 RepID=A0A1Y1Y3C3_9FUNG|nr:hypothetical protein K493DRAFT_303297 [Basidiobolus meristosporus CBS 931.73]|eukprot:ORX92488.1 hypothetical protein K493DRAFT_303297 [Basidiobolus meristosporus CBS 931.73]